MKSIEITYTGNHDDTTRKLKKLKGKKWVQILDKFGKEGVDALRENTPKDSGLTADSWRYVIDMPQPGQIRLIFVNDNVVNDWANVAILLQYGHATGTGGWVEGRDYINPSIQPIFDRIAAQAWKEVKDV